jgi:hypothetical protein
MVMMFNTTFNNISVLWWSVLLMEQTGVSGKKTRTVASIDKLYHITTDKEWQDVA